MDIPSGSFSNPSVWGARVWVPAGLLAAAAGWPTPELMYHLRTQLDAQLQDPQGALNKQVSRAGAGYDTRGASDVVK